MAKDRPRLACRECGHVTTQWLGRCPSCDSWGTIEASFQPGTTGPAPMPLAPSGALEARIPTGLEGVDRVLGGGLVPGSVVLLAGEPGIGKSTLLLQLAEGLSGDGRTCLLASGEETADQVAARAARLGIPGERVSFVAGRDLRSVVDAARAARPTVLVVDSIQAIRSSELPSLPGGPAQVRACADALVGLAKEQGIAVLLVGQVTKDGDVAGPRTLEHAVDVVCSFDGDPATGLRILAAGKNRFGPEGEISWYEMSAQGLREVDPGSLLAPQELEPGAATALLIAGRRALAVEVQALAIPTDGPPRRHVSGLDARRFGLIAAVVDRAAGIPLARCELYGSAAGGIRVGEPGADLAVAAALASAVTGWPPPPAAFAGEVSLTGTVRPPVNLTQRLQAARAAGLRTVFCAGETSGSADLEVVPVRHVREALGWARGGAKQQGHVRSTRAEAVSSAV
ncbi:MAG: ATPase domain-containing protein [Actinomycetota bacterium]